ncbi:uncharacterized protein LOC111089271 [Limulus polyphemus]|uniref:Uncharacterized protein LOC111089271 n=1 Tax=Limulus polyphemus TaxID=6850 RepID=A0ABM1TMR1_LIMPO|nr:uncharacterized protein LOC111089271 [Limulus polyphemus]
MLVVQNFQLMICLMTSFYWTSMGYVANEKNKRNDPIPVLQQGRSLKPVSDEWAFFLRKGRSPVFDFLPFSYLMVEDMLFKSSEKANDPKLVLHVFTPRIGRKKRSMLQEHGADDQTDWLGNLAVEDGGVQNIFRQVIPTPYVSRKILDGDSIDEVKRVFFTPRIGRAPFIPRIERANPNKSSDFALIPLTGRAPYISKIGTMDN